MTKSDFLPDYIYHGDCRELLPQFPEKSVDLIFADPPYNLQLQHTLRRPNLSEVDAVDDHWDQFDDFASYDQFTRDWLTACRRVLKDTGTLWVIGSYHNIYRVGSILQDLGFWFLNDVVWIKCLAGHTRVFVRDEQRWVRQITLSDLSQLAGQRMEILGPRGWRRLVGVARSSVLKPKMRLQAGYMGEVTVSQEHLVPIWRYNYGEKYLEKTVGDLALESAQTYLMQVDFSQYLSETYAEIDIPALMVQECIPLFVRGGYTAYKQHNPYGTWGTFLERRHNYPNLHWFLYRDLMPVPVAEVENVAIESLTSHYAKNKESFPTKMALTEEWGFLIGLYVAEGNMDKRSQVRFSLHEKETALVDRIETLLEPYGVPVFRFKIKQKKCMAAYFGSAIVKAIIRHFVQGENARTKSLVMVRILNTPLAFRQGLLNGFLAGDGHYEPDHDRFSASSASPKLVKDIQLLAQSVGYYATIGQTQCYLKATRKHYPVHWLNIYKRKPREAGGIDFHPVLATITVENEYSADWYDLVVEDGLFLIEGGIVVHNSNPMPNFRGVRFTNAHETLLWCKKSKHQKRYTFNYHAMKMANDGKQMRSDWEIPLCTGSERLTLNGEKLHTTQKPEALLYRVILASSNPGDLILDPFFGTGTTGAVAKKLGRHYVGIEREETYIAGAQERIAKISAPLANDDELYGKYETKRSAPRIAFASLIENGLLLPGQPLYFNKQRDKTATILADGSLRMGDGVRGSIHKMGAIAGNLPACNGWEHWFYEDAAGDLIVIDGLRDTLRKSQSQVTIHPDSTHDL